MGRPRVIDAHVADGPRPCFDVAKFHSSAPTGFDASRYTSAITLEIPEMSGVRAP